MSNENAPVNETPVNETAPENATEATNENAEATTEDTRKSAPRDTFMEVWETVVVEISSGELNVQSGIDEVSDRLKRMGYSAQPSTVQQRSTDYRKKKGLPLSRMPRGGGARFNVTEAQDSLAAIKAKLAEKRAAAEKQQEETEADAGSGSES